MAAKHTESVWENYSDVDAFPLTDMQQAFWVARMAGKKQQGAKIFFEFSIKNADPQQLQQAWLAVLQQHPMLRCALTPQANQVIRSDITTRGWSCQPANDNDIEQCRQALSERYFQLHEWPFYDIRVLVMAEREAIVLGVIDEMILDGPSLSILLQDWAAFYCRGEVLTVQSHEFTFRDYCRYFEKKDDAERRENDSIYWQTLLEKVNWQQQHPVLIGTTDKLSSPRRHSASLSQKQWSSLQQYAKTCRVTPSLLLLSQFAFSLQRCAEWQYELPLLLTLFNRQPLHQNVTTLIGPFISSMVMIAPPIGKETTEEYTVQLQRQFWDNFDHSSLNSIGVRRLLRQKHGQSAVLPIVFTSMLNALPLLTDDENITSWARQVHVGSTQTSTPDVALECQLMECDGQLQISWDYASGSVDETLLRKAFTHFISSLLTLSGDWRDRALTIMQQAYFVGQRMSRENAATTSLMYQELDIVGLDFPRLQRTWNSLINRHDMLRGTLLAEGTLRIFHHVPHYAIEYHDLRGVLFERQQIWRGELQQQAGKRVFTPGEWPFFHCQVSRFTEQQYCIHLILDGLMLDARSIALLLSEWMALYRNEKLCLPAFPVSWETWSHNRQRYPVEAIDAERQYWQHKFSRLPDGPAIFDALSVASTGKRANHRIVIDDISMLLALTKDNLPLDALLLSAWVYALRQVHTSPFTLVVVSWERPHQWGNIEHLAGDFTRLCWIEIDDTISGDLLHQARQLWQRVKDDLAQEWVDGLSQMRALPATQQGNRFPVVFTCLPLSEPPVMPAGASLGYSQSQTPQVLLDHIALLTDKNLVIQWDYSVDALNSQCLETLINHYQKALLMLDPSSPPQKIDNNLRYPRAQWHQTALVWSAPDTFAACLEAALARRDLDSIALRWQGKSTNYRELKQRSAQLVNHIQSLGIQPTQRVVVLLERSEWLSLTLLACARAGLCFIPIDPGWPAERIRFVIEDSQAEIVITQASLSAWIGSNLAARVLLLDEETEASIALQPDTLSCPLKLAGNDPAYIIYTSGTTGKPKGCVNTQRGITNRLLWMQHTFGLTTDSNLLQKTPQGFDVSVWEFFWPALSGATQIILAAGKHVDPHYMVNTIRQEQVHILHFVPSMLGLFLNDPEAGACQSLQHVIVSGEALPAKLIHQFYQVFPQASLHNLYGPTEAAIDVTHWPCQPDWPHAWVPIGKPIANTQLYILDERQQEVPVGEEGELYIGGHNVASGYWLRDELTAERFIDSPFASSQSTKLYRTGDRARYSDDGNIVYLGRTDQQIKIRGQRVELDEIEHAITEKSLLRELAVIPFTGKARKEGEEENIRLIACYAADKPLNEAELTSRLRKILPEYMLPVRYQRFSTLPLTANGKLDRRLLSESLRTHQSNKQIIDVNEGAVKEAIKDIADYRHYLREFISQQLETEMWGDEDDLFTLGATSFTLIRIAQFINESWQVELEVDQLLHSPSLKKLLDSITDSVSVEERKCRQDDKSAHKMPSSLLVALDADAKEAFKHQQIAVRQFTSDYEIYPLADMAENEWELFRHSSFREFNSEPISFTDFSRFIGVLKQCEWNKKPKRAWPSGGGFYPVQIYIHVRPNRVENVPEGLYFYHPIHNTLIRLQEKTDISAELHVRYNADIYEQSAFGLFLVSTPAAIEPAYGNRLGKLYTTLEAGYICQWLMEKMTDSGLGLCPIGDWAFDKARANFDLQPEQELLATLLCGALNEKDREICHHLRPQTHQAVTCSTKQNTSRDKQGKEQELIAIIGFDGNFGGVSADGLLWEYLEQGKRVLNTCRYGQVAELKGAFYPENVGFDDPAIGDDADLRMLTEQQKHIIAAVQNCLDNAGYSPNALEEVGVFSGVMWEDQTLNVADNYRERDRLDQSVGRTSFAHITSHVFNFTGPSMVIDGGCASTLQAIEQAIAALRSGKCSHAFVIASNLVNHSLHVDYLLNSGLACAYEDSSAFSDNARGWLVGEGTGALLLKPLAQAEADGDYIHGVIHDVISKHSGQTRQFGISNPDIQNDLLKKLIKRCGWSFDDVDYVETAAGGSALSDALEFRTLEKAFAQREVKQPLLLGSVKPNLGHLEAASGMTQLAKVLLQFRHQRWAPTLLFGKRNPVVREGRLRIATAENIADIPLPKRVLINNNSGTGNFCSMALEYYVPLTQSSSESSFTSSVYWVPISASDTSRLDELQHRLAVHLAQKSDSLASIARTLQCRRHAYSVRRVFQAQDLPMLIQQLRQSEELPQVSILPVPIQQWLHSQTDDWPVAFLAQGQRCPLPAIVRLHSGEYASSSNVNEKSAAQTHTLIHQKLLWETLCQVVSEVLEMSVEKITPATDLLTCGLSSHDAVRLAVRFEEQTGFVLPLESLFTSANLGTLSAELEPVFPPERNVLLNE
ncbi:putative Phenylalanine racemase (ATP-hydrolyzing) [Xenorhabdus nematophila ATCC 19061]|uniref:Phenylalanine racemase (ATP-hydrolyzing) n=2 Tax=Xenorhabdus nematophila TaxID=628 RepID=D3VCV7_XENNA|nr:putative Phenylalanine racemase (ATP-hydrolyzing) [Xenorhabdus nematophila ATCC 19061]CEK22708.1 putative Phenylalanine racemase (ATP-hydrolyzing) [Xenorhabdus nematophila AN6/1]